MRAQCWQAEIQIRLKVGPFVEERQRQPLMERFAVPQAFHARRIIGVGSPTDKRLQTSVVKRRVSEKLCYLRHQAIRRAST
jgi:hypothetical protein